ncbi:hypothetical protein BOTCAL_0139g00030 [Botryotinia calthae]|uniref:F-box domain-containing protein n=1 Tax=Botryotinia calthae TaxID=38488 RepID=A0A4Y8D326_9HELO|nr:hypothetical protein BOTCAL_0139g00030 [Botryotinia calthae]
MEWDFNPHLLEDNRPTLSSFESSSKSPLGFLDLALEIRRMIYEEYFSVTELISFQTASSSSLALHLDKNYGLHTALLRVNNQVHSEAAPYLYSNPELNFVGIRPTKWLPTTDSALAYFLKKTCRVYKLDEDSMGMLKQISDRCTGLVTLRMELPEFRCRSEALDDHHSLRDEISTIGWLNEQLQVMPFLRDIVVHVQVFEKKLSYKFQDWRKQSQKLGWKFEITEYEGTGNKVDDYERYYDAAADLIYMQDRMHVLKRGYYIIRKTTNGEYEVDYELSHRVAHRKFEEGLLKSAKDEPTAIRKSHP